MIRVGIIGYGKMGKLRHDIISSINEAKVILIHDSEIINVNIEKANKPEQIIKNQKLDAVFICTPNYLNKPLTIQCLKAGKHVFCEKPPAFTAKDVEEIRKEEKESGKVLMYGFNHRFHDSIMKMKTLIEKKEFGKVLWMRGRYGKSVDSTFKDTWRSKKKYAGGGILLDQGIHMLDLFVHLGGNFNKIQSTVSNLYWKLDVEDNVFVNLENTTTGMAASIHSTMTQWRHLFSLEIFLEKGYMVLNGLKTPSNSYGKEILTIARNRSAEPSAVWNDEENLTYQTNESWKLEVTEFFSAIEQNRSVSMGTSLDALNLMKIIDKVYNSK